MPLALIVCCLPAVLQDYNTVLVLGFVIRVILVLMGVKGLLQHAVMGMVETARQIGGFG